MFDSSLYGIGPHVNLIVSKTKQRLTHVIYLHTWILLVYLYNVQIFCLEYGHLVSLPWCYKKLLGVSECSSMSSFAMLVIVFFLPYRLESCWYAAVIGLKCGLLDGGGHFIFSSSLCYNCQYRRVDPLA